MTVRVTDLATIQDTHDRLILMRDMVKELSRPAYVAGKIGLQPSILKAFLSVKGMEIDITGYEALKLLDSEIFETKTKLEILGVEFGK